MGNRKLNGTYERSRGEWAGGALLGKCLRLLTGLTVLLAAQGVSGAEKTGGEVAAELKFNVVRVTTVKEDSSTGPAGFGFIVGEKNRYLYIVTAKHVVVGRDLDNLVDERYVRFFGQAQEKSVRAEFIGAAPPRDLALLKAPKPRDLAWLPQSMAAEGTSRRGTRAWYVGKGDDWYVPTDAGAGTVNRLLGNDLIDIDMPSAREGTSGAPLVTRDGIAGMVLISEQRAAVEALSIDAIKSAFDQHHVWEAYPWSLSAFPPCHEAPTGLVHWWPGDGNTNDMKGGNHGIAKGAVSYVTGKVGQAFSFDGMDSYVVSASAIGLSGNKARTVSTWIFADQSTAAVWCCPTPLSWGADAKGRSFGIFSALGSWHFWGNIDANENMDIKIAVAPRAEWVNHTITYDRREVIYYIDGTPIARADRKLNTASAPIHMGRAFLRRDQPMDTPFKGMLDELQIYSRALSPEEVHAIYDVDRGGICKE